ncbi:MAG: mechanosensitive ion channel [Acidobacteriota bacterium]|jgi:small conductance mechanosensitive channel|nr:mechanosensitive ion channel [Acidobacteriota bacterium]
MKKFLRTFLVALLLTLPVTAQSEPPDPAVALDELEASLQNFQAQYDTLEQFSPHEFPDFKELEISHQLIERLDFNKRRFDLLVSMYNLLEDKLLPRLVQLSARQPRQRSLWMNKAARYLENGETGLMEIQRRINSVSLQIERLEKQIERLRESERQKELLSVTTLESRPAAEVPLSLRMRQRENELKKYTSNLKAESERLETLRKQHEEQEKKIAEKREEIRQLEADARASGDPVARRVKAAFARVRNIRLNGLEIPKLNTTQTFVYVTENRIQTLKNRIAATQEELENLKIQRRRELRNQILHGFIIIVIAVLMVFILNRIAHQLVRRTMRRVEASGNLDSHHKQRYQTLSSVILSIVKVLLWILAVLWVLGELNIDYAPFLVAAGGLSLAIGFGAQSLVKDFFSGFFMLMEEQLALGDVVEINGKEGTVEKISFRTIKMRALDGTMHIIPNGSINSVSNLTHKWSMAVINIGVAYDVEAEKVMRTLEEISADLMRDREWQSRLEEAPVPQGIVSFGDSAVNYRILAKTAPGEQWAVGRELNLRIKRAFDAAGIEIPYNYVNVINRTPDTAESG